MPQIIAHWSFKDTVENIDIARIFREAPPEARVLRIVVGSMRCIAMRQELYDRARKTGIRPPSNPITRRRWDPINNLAGEPKFRLSNGKVLRLPRSPMSGWVFTFSEVRQEVLNPPSLRVFDLLDWLNRAEAYYDSLVETKVRRTDMKVCIVLSDPWLQYKNGAVCNDPWRGSWFVFGRNYEQYKSCFATTGSHYKGVWAQRPCEQRALRFLGRCEGGGVLT